MVCFFISQWKRKNTLIDLSVFKDKNFSMNELKYEISRLLVGKNMKLFNFNESIKKIEKSILNKISNYGEIKYKKILYVIIKENYQ